MKKARLALMGIAVFAVAISSAQSFHEKIANVALLQNKDVQAELGITEALRDKMNKFADEFNAKANKAQEDFVKKNPDAQSPTPALMKQIEGYKKTLDKNVLGVLTKVQVKRLGEITLQTAGYPALMDPTVGKEVGLSDSQIKKLRDAFQLIEQSVQRMIEKERKKIADKYDKQYDNEDEANAAQKKVNEESAAAMNRIQPELTKLRDQWMVTMKKTVKAIQLNKFDALTGKPFNPKGS